MRFNFTYTYPLSIIYEKSVWTVWCQCFNFSFEFFLMCLNEFFILEANNRTEACCLLCIYLWSDKSYHEHRLLLLFGVLAENIFLIIDVKKFHDLTLKVPLHYSSKCTMRLFNFSDFKGCALYSEGALIRGNALIKKSRKKKWKRDVIKMFFFNNY